MYLGMYLCSYVCTANTSKSTLEIFIDEAFYLYQKYLDIVSQKFFFLEHMVNLGGVCPETVQFYVSWSALRIYLFIYLLQHFIMMVHNRQTHVILTLVVLF